MHIAGIWIAEDQKKVGATCVLSAPLEMLTHRWAQSDDNNIRYIA